MVTVGGKYTKSGFPGRTKGLIFTCLKCIIMDEEKKKD
jgi:hypothetical protein